MKIDFASELGALIQKHVGNPEYGDELRPIADALHAAADALAMQADRYRWRGESEHEFERRRGWQMTNTFGI